MHNAACLLYKIIVLKLLFPFMNVITTALVFSDPYVHLCAAMLL